MDELVDTEGFRGWHERKANRLANKPAGQWIPPPLLVEAVEQQR
jgi:hypothetical protein